MNIAVNALSQIGGGCLTNLRQLFEEWNRTGVFEKHRFALFTSTNTWRRLADVTPPAVKTSVVKLSNLAPLRLVVEQTLLVYLARKFGAQVMFNPGNSMPLLTPFPSVASFANAAPYCANFAPNQIGITGWLRVNATWAFQCLSAMRATKVIFISKYYQDIFVNKHGFPVKRGVHIYRARGYDPACGADRKAFIALGYPIKRPYILSIGNLYLYKNIVELIEGFAIARRSRPGADAMQLVLAGAPVDSAYLSRVESVIKRLELGPDHVTLLGSVPHDHIESLLAGCELYVSASTCENCPVNLVEALSMGTAVVCSNVGVMPEIGGDAVEYFDPYDPADIGRALSRLMADEHIRGEFRSKAIVRAQSFPDKAEVAAQTLAVIESVAQTHASASMMKQRTCTRVPL